jgi:hypothetical protein
MVPVHALACRACVIDPPSGRQLASAAACLSRSACRVFCSGRSAILRSMARPGVGAFLAGFHRTHIRGWAACSRPPVRVHLQLQTGQESLAVSGRVDQQTDKRQMREHPSAFLHPLGGCSDRGMRLPVAKRGKQHDENVAHVGEGHPGSFVGLPQRFQFDADLLTQPLASFSSRPSASLSREPVA